MDQIARKALREAKNYTKGYTDMQIKVREATSNDPWGPSGSQMAEIADATYHSSDLLQVMDILDKRLNDSGKNWRHVFKALTLLDYLIHCGSEQVIAYAKQNLYIIKTLKEFQFIDEEGRDQGVNIREKSKAIASLLADDERLTDERKARAALRNRMAGPSGMSSGYSAGSSGRRPSYQPSSVYEEDHHLERAIQESRRSAMEEERRQKEKEREEREMRIAMEASRADLQRHQTQPQQSYQSAQVSQQQTSYQNGGGDLWHTDSKQQDLDFFSSMATSAPVQSNQPDPFGFGQQQNHAFPAAMQQQQPFGQPNSPPQPFGQLQQSQMFAQPQNASMAGSQSASPPFNALPAPGGASFDVAFDQGAGQKNLVPRYVQGQSNPNAALAHIARNAAQIDPFANLAATSSGSNHNLSDLNFGGVAPNQTATPQTFQQSGAFDPFGNSPSMGRAQPSGGVLQPQVMAPNPFPVTSNNNNATQQKSSDPFAALVAFPNKQPSNPQQSTAVGGKGASLNAMSNSSASPPSYANQSGAPMGMSNPSYASSMGMGHGMNGQLMGANSFGQPQQNQFYRPPQPGYPQQQPMGYGGGQQFPPQSQQQNNFFF